LGFGRLNLFRTHSLAFLSTVPLRSCTQTVRHRDLFSYYGGGDLCKNEVPTVSRIY